MSDPLRPSSVSLIIPAHVDQGDPIPIGNVLLDSFVLGGDVSGAGVVSELQRPIARALSQPSLSSRLPPLSDPRRAAWEKDHPIEARFYKLREDALAGENPPRVVVQLEMQGGFGDIAFGKKLKDKLAEILPAGSTVIFVGNVDVIEAARNFGFTVELLDSKKHANADVLIVAPLVISKPRLAAKHVLHLVEYSSLHAYTESPREAHGQALLLGPGGGYGGLFLDVPKISSENADAVMDGKLSCSAAPGLRQNLRDAGPMVAMVYVGEGYLGSLGTLIEVAKSRPVVALVQTKIAGTIPANWPVIEHPNGLDESLLKKHPTSVHIVRASSMPHEEMVACLQSADLVFCTGDHTPVETLVCNPNAPWLYDMLRHKKMFIADLQAFASNNSYWKVWKALTMGTAALQGNAETQRTVAPMLIDPEFRLEWSRFAQAVTAVFDLTLSLGNTMLTCRTHEAHPQWRAAEDLLTLACRHEMPTQEALRLCVAPFDEQKMTAIWRETRPWINPWMLLERSIFSNIPWHQYICDVSMLLHAAIHFCQKDRDEIADTVWGYLQDKHIYLSDFWMAVSRLDAMSEKRAFLWVDRYIANTSQEIGRAALEAMKLYPALRGILMVSAEAELKRSSWKLIHIFDVCLSMTSVDSDREHVWAWFLKMQSELFPNTQLSELHIPYWKLSPLCVRFLRYDRKL